MQRFQKCLLNIKFIGSCFLTNFEKMGNKSNKKFENEEDKEKAIMQVVNNPNSELYFKELIKKYDSDKNNKIDREEFSDIVKKIFFFNNNSPSY
jgi:hypothetical protein